MDKRLSSDDFVAANEEIARLSGRDKDAETEHERRVCSRYTIVDGTILPRYPYDEDHFSQWRHYDPLIDTPDLFLRFAKLYDQGLTEESVLEWTREYGCLGLGVDWGKTLYGDKVKRVRAGGTLDEEIGDALSGIENPVDRPAIYQVMSTLLDYNSRVLETEDPLKGFQDEAIIAAAVLKMYEAALSENKEEARRLVVLEFPFIALMRVFNRPFWRPIAQRYFGESLTDELRATVFKGVEETNDFARQNREATTNFILHFKASRGTEADFVNDAFSNSLTVVERRVRALCYPKIVLTDPEGEYGPDNLKSGWGYRNLLGVMYLQMHWLITSGSEVTRCERCGRIISLAKAPIPGARKPPRHKRFCNAYCRYNHHYETKKKPAREGEASS